MAPAKGGEGRARGSARAGPAGWRRWLLRLALMLAAPALFFALLELGLRAAGCGFHPGFFVEGTIDGREVCIENRRFTWRFFPPALARPPDHLVVPLVKPAGTCRIFVLGGSAARGDPAPEFGFARILGVMLRERYPEERFEVVNAAITAVNSNVVLPAARDCAERGADVLVVYLGHNEVIGPYGPGTVFAPFSSSLRVVRASVAVKATRTGQLLDGLRRLLSGERGAPEGWAGMEMFLKHGLHASDPRLESVYDHLRGNLRDICRLARRAGTQVILCTVAGNLRGCSPFASMHSPKLSDEDERKWTAAYEAGVASEESGGYTDAVRCYLQAERLDEGFAALQFRMARCRWTLGEYDEARERYARARDLDALRFRADARINETIREVAAAEGVLLADAERAFEKASPHGVPGEELFHEHVHMNFCGNHLLARTVMGRLAGVLDDARPRPLSEEECAERLALTGWDECSIVAEVLERMRAPPFTNQLDHAETVARLKKRLASLRREAGTAPLDEAAEAYRRAIERAPEDWVLHEGLGMLLRKACGDPAGAAARFRAVLRRVPHNLRARANLGMALAELGKIDEAVNEYRKALDVEPRSAEVHNNLAIALSRQGKGEEAVARFSEALGIRPDYPEAHNNLGVALFGRGETEGAAEHFSEAIRLLPGYANAHNNLGLARARQGKPREAIACFREAVRLRPEFAEARRNLEGVLSRPGSAER